jgi:hypothetical protein
VAGAAWRAVMRIVAGVGDLVQRIERSAGAMCGLHRARGDKERGFLG